MEIYVGWHDWERARGELGEVVAGAGAGTAGAGTVDGAGTVERVDGAVEFAREWHGEQKRPTGAPYLDHLLEALEILVRGARIYDADILCAAVLHDVVEDTPCTLADVRLRFGSRVAELVGWVTIPETEPGEDKATVKESYLRHLAQAPRDALRVKLADRASNVQTLRNLNPDKQRTYYAQTVTYIMPLAQKADPWFSQWFAAWQADFADLG
ncbi:MAG TPA: HD domain-containing protein [Streptosporangiaceae bacterium]|nr:HD domain-containing protein [Streptosporangiaceae bacterium]